MCSSGREIRGIVLLLLRVRMWGPSYAKVNTGVNSFHLVGPAWGRFHPAGRFSIGLARYVIEAVRESGSAGPHRLRNLGKCCAFSGGQAVPPALPACGRFFLSLLPLRPRLYRSETKSCPPGKPPALRRYFYLFTFFDEEGNADLQTGLQPGRLGHAAARRVAPHTRFRGGNFQLNERWQL